MTVSKNQSDVQQKRFDYEHKAEQQNCDAQVRKIVCFGMEDADRCIIIALNMSMDAKRILAETSNIKQNVTNN